MEREELDRRVLVQYFIIIQVIFFFLDICCLGKQFLLSPVLNNILLYIIFLDVEIVMRINQILLSHFFFLVEAVFRI